MTITLVGVNSKFIHSNLALRYLKAYTKDLDFKCDLIEVSINDRIERVLEYILSKKPNIVAFSCYIWNLEYVERLSNLIKLVHPEIKILYGGPEVSFDSERFLSKAAGDYLIEGEGEETFRVFIQSILNGYDLENISGLYFKRGSEIIYGGKRKLLDLNDLEFPYGNEDDLDNKIVYYEASRGCPFNCKYCLSSTIRGVRFLNLDRVKKELQFFIDKQVNLVKFVDRTFNCDCKFAMEIWEFLINVDTKTTFHFEISADILNKEQLELLARAPKGRFQFEVGVQTTNKTVLKNINRFVAFEEIKNQVLELQKYGNIKQHLDLIAGLPGENFVSFKKSFNDLYKIKPEEIQLGFLKVLKGSPMKEEAVKWGIIHSPYSPYEVLKTNDISYEEITQLKRVEEMVDKYYNSQKFNTIIKYFEKKFEEPFDFYLSLGEFFHFQGYFSRNISSVDYYKVFLEFNSIVLKEDNGFLKDAVKYDYLSFNKKKWLPDFLMRDTDKKLERTLREFFKLNSNLLPFENYHIEKFDYNISKFLENGKIIKENSYFIFDEKNVENIKDITYIISEENLLN